MQTKTKIISLCASTLLALSPVLPAFTNGAQTVMAQSTESTQNVTPNQYIIKYAVNKADSKAESIQGYEIKNGQAYLLPEINFNINTQVYVYKGSQVINGVSYTKLYVGGADEASTNEWVRTDQLADSPMKSELKQHPVVRELMHAAALYTKNGKKSRRAILKSYSRVPIINKKIKIGKNTYYQLANSTKYYIRSGNVDPTTRKILAKAYIYTGSGKNYTIKRGKKSLKLYYSAKVKKNTLKTWGGTYKITTTVRTRKGRKRRVTRKYYRVNKGQYVLASKLSGPIKK